MNAVIAPGLEPLAEPLAAPALATLAFAQLVPADVDTDPQPEAQWLAAQRDSLHAVAPPAGQPLPAWPAAGRDRPERAQGGHPRTIRDHAAVDRGGKIDQGALEHAGLEHAGLEHAGLEHAGLEHAGPGHIGLEPAGLEPAGLDRTGSDRAGRAQAVLNRAGSAHADPHHAGSNAASFEPGGFDPAGLDPPSLDPAGSGRAASDHAGLEQDGLGHDGPEHAGLDHAGLQRAGLAHDGAGHAWLDHDRAWDAWRRAPAPEDAHLHRLVDALSLSPIEAMALALAVAVDGDPAAARAMAWLQAPRRDPHPTLGLLARLGSARRHSTHATFRTLLDGPALACGLLVLDRAAPSLPDAALRVPLPLLAALFGGRGDWPDVSLDTGSRTAQACTDAVRAQAAAHARALSGDLLVRSADIAESRAGCRLIARALGRPAALIGGPPPEGLGPWLVLHDAVPVLHAELAPGERRAVPAIPGYDGPLLVATGLDGGWERDGQAVPGWQMPMPTVAERARLWRDHGMDAADAQMLARTYRLGAERTGQLARSAQALRAAASAGAGPHGGLHRDGMHRDGLHRDGMHREPMRRDAMHVEGMCVEGMPAEGMPDNRVTDGRMPFDDVRRGRDDGAIDPCGTGHATIDPGTPRRRAAADLEPDDLGPDERLPADRRAIERMPAEGAPAQGRADDAMAGARVDERLLARACVAGAARHAGRGVLGTLAEPLSEDIDDEALILPDTLRQDLRALVARCRVRDGLADGLGAAARARYRPGVRGLFVGASGTGKTLACGWLATRLGLPLYRVDMASISSKYIGDTEKHLGELFARAESSNVVLLFDEADALFGKRTEVKDANDRYANQQTNYLLQRIEAYDGIVLLTSNSRSRFDTAFTRRLDAILDFPQPQPDERRALWLAHLGQAHAIAPGDLNRLAAGCELAGGHIRNVVLAARALSPDAPIPWPALAGALAGEYRKLGKPVPSLLAMAAATATGAATGAPTVRGG